MESFVLKKRFYVINIRKSDLKLCLALSKLSKDPENTRNTLFIYNNY